MARFRARFSTAKFCDSNEKLVLSGELRILQPIFQVYGTPYGFSGPVVTVKVFEDNVLVREFMDNKGHGRVLVIDGGGSLRCSLFGGSVAERAEANGWAGVVLNGCVRDVYEINLLLNLGIRAINSHPVKANKRGIGEKHVPVTFAGTRITDGEWLYADNDGIVVCNKELSI